MRKGQSISINTIIVAAIALAVLVVLFAIFTGRLGAFTKGVQKADTCTQKCASLNMDYSIGATNQNTCNNKEDTYVAGTYEDGIYGCCCKPKPVQST